MSGARSGVPGYQNARSASYNPYVNSPPNSDNGWNLPRGLLWILIGLAGVIIVGLLGAVYSKMNSDIDDLKKVSKETSKEIVDTRAELAKSINAVQVQAAVANTRLDSILQELQKRR